MYRVSGLSWHPSAVYLQRTDRNYSGSGAAAPPPHSQAAPVPLPGRDRAAPDPAGVITRYYPAASDTYYFTSAHYAARLPVDLGGEQHPSGLVRARLPRGGKAEQPQARQRRQYLKPNVTIYVTKQTRAVGEYVAGYGVIGSGAYRK